MYTHTHIPHLNPLVNCPTSAKCEDTFTFDGTYLHQIRHPVNTTASWVLQGQSKNLKCRLQDFWQLLLYKLPRLCNVLQRAPIVTYSSVFDAKHQKKPNTNMSSPESKCFKRIYSCNNLTFLWISRTRVWAWHQTTMSNWSHPVLITTPCYKVQGLLATLATCELLDWTDCTKQRHLHNEKWIFLKKKQQLRYTLQFVLPCAEVQRIWERAGRGDIGCS